jgi:lysyl-tRNA synthetase class II
MKSTKREKLKLWTDRVLTSKKRSTDQEKRVAKVLFGRLQPRSGAGDFMKADLLTEDFLVECKTTKARSYSLKLEDLMKIFSHAIECGCRDPLFIVTFENAMKPTAYRKNSDSDWAVLPLETLKGLLDARKNMSHKAKKS